MRLVVAVLGWVLRKLGYLAALVLVLFGGYLLVQVFVPTVQDAVADRERLERVGEERAALERDLGELRATVAEHQIEAVSSLEAKVSAEIEEVEGQIEQKRSEVADLREGRAEACGFWSKVGSAVLPGDACGAAEKAVERADAALDTLESNLGKARADAAVLSDPDLTPAEKIQRLGGGGDPVAERQIAGKESELAAKEAEQHSLEQARTKGVAWVVDKWMRSWRWLLGLALLALLLPPTLRTLSYFVLMPALTRAHRPMHLAADQDSAAATLATAPAQRTLVIELAEGEVLSARSEYVRPVQGKVRSQWLYDWSAPFVSFASGLHLLSRITSDGEVVSTTLAAPDDPDVYLMRIDFADHPGVVMQPRHVVGVIGAPEIRTRWNWGLLAFATGQFRYIMFAGTGSLIVQGLGDVATADPGGASLKMNQNLVMGFDSRLGVGVNRTEVFLPYLRGRAPLVDDQFSGTDVFFWQKSTTAGSANPIARAFDAVFSAFGKVLGF